MVPRSFCPGIWLLLKVMDAKAALMSGGLGLETFTRLSISTHLPAVSMAHRGNTLMNSKDWGLGGKQRGGARASGRVSRGFRDTVYQGRQETLHSFPDTAYGFCRGLGQCTMVQDRAWLSPQSPWFTVEVGVFQPEFKSWLCDIGHVTYHLCLIFFNLCTFGG